jgi:hypothetical protein
LIAPLRIKDVDHTEKYGGRYKKIVRAMVQMCANTPQKK